MRDLLCDSEIKHASLFAQVLYFILVGFATLARTNLSLRFLLPEEIVLRIQKHTRWRESHVAFWPTARLTPGGITPGRYGLRSSLWLTTDRPWAVIQCRACHVMNDNQKNDFAPAPRITWRLALCLSITRSARYVGCDSGTKLGGVGLQTRGSCGKIT